MVGPVLVVEMVVRSCWFQASTTLSPAAAWAGFLAATAKEPTVKGYDEAQDGCQFACHPRQLLV
jgi:hypothetical protein